MSWKRVLGAAAKTVQAGRPIASDSQAGEMVTAYLEEAMAVQAHESADLKIHHLPAGKRILDADAELRARIVVEAARHMLSYEESYSEAGHSFSENYDTYTTSLYLLRRSSWLVSRLLRRRLPFRENDLVALIRSAMKHPWHWPLAGLLGAIEKHVAEHGLQPSVKTALVKMQGGLSSYHDSAWRGLCARIARMTEDKDKVVIPGSELGMAIVEWVNARDAKSVEAWTKLLQHAMATENKSSPTARWLKDAEPLRDAVGGDAVAAQLADWTGTLNPDSVHAEPTSDLIKGLIWLVTDVDDDRMPSVIGRLCETCYKKVPGIGPANVKLGNACIYGLGEMPGERAAAELVRLKSRIKFNNGRKKPDEALTAAAERSGLTVADLEEIALPTFGLDADGRRTVMLGEVAADIRIAGSDEVTLSWTGADGKPRKTVPASVKADHADELKSLRAEVKEIKGQLAGQRWRLESLYLAQRTWSFADWRRRYLEQPLLANLARRLIWNFGDVGAVPTAEGFIDADGKVVKAAKDSTVSLWHPIEAKADDVLAWRRRLAALEITQPFKQAHREIYVLTDAERATETYSNRFAAHILRQQQLNALCQARAWRFGQFLIWDLSGAVPARPLPGFGVQAEFWVDPIDHDQHTETTGAYLFLATDQVRFVDDTETAVPLSQVPPLVFSEVMREVDLFVGVASVANNPEWQDGGPEGRHRDYWWGFSFGALGETAKTRKAVLEDILPRLKIADRCELKDKFLRVRGTRRTYKIHLGSGNILMAPNDEYLCIVRGGRGQRSDNIRLPFEGDTMLSLILSKAFLLAADDKITDRTILSQIGGK